MRLMSMLARFQINRLRATNCKVSIFVNMQLLRLLIGKWKRLDKRIKKNNLIKYKNCQIYNRLSLNMILPIIVSALPINTFKLIIISIYSLKEIKVKHMTIILMQLFKTLPIAYKMQYLLLQITWLLIIQFRAK